MATGTTGGSGGTAENAAAQAKAADVAASAPTAPQPRAEDEGRKNAPRAEAGTATASEPVEVVTEVKEADVEPIGEVIAVAPTSVSTVMEVDEDADGGTSFDYGFKDEKHSTKGEQNAEQLYAYEEALRNENPDKVIYRTANSVRGVGGQSFDYGKPPKKETSKKASKKNDED